MALGRFNHLSSTSSTPTEPSERDRIPRIRPAGLPWDSRPVWRPKVVRDGGDREIRIEKGDMVAPLSNLVPVVTSDHQWSPPYKETGSKCFRGPKEG